MSEITVHYDLRSISYWRLRTPILRQIRRHQERGLDHRTERGLGSLHDMLAHRQGPMTLCLTRQDAFVGDTGQRIAGLETMAGIFSQYGVYEIAIHQGMSLSDIQKNALQLLKFPGKPTEGATWNGITYEPLPQDSTMSPIIRKALYEELRGSITNDSWKAIDALHKISLVADLLAVGAMACWCRWNPECPGIVGALLGLGIIGSIVSGYWNIAEVHVSQNPYGKFLNPSIKPTMRILVDALYPGATYVQEGDLAAAVGKISDSGLKELYTSILPPGMRSLLEQKK